MITKKEANKLMGPKQAKQFITQYFEFRDGTLKKDELKEIKKTIGKPALFLICLKYYLTTEQLRKAKWKKQNKKSKN